MYFSHISLLFSLISPPTKLLLSKSPSYLRIFVCVCGPVHLTKIACMSVGGDFLWYILILGEHRMLKGLN